MNIQIISKKHSTDIAAFVLCALAVVHSAGFKGTFVLLAVAVVGLLLLFKGAAQLGLASASDDVPMAKVDLANRTTEEQKMDAAIHMMLVALAWICLILGELVWGFVAFFPLEKFGDVMVTSPLSWLITNVAAVAAGLAAYKNAPPIFRKFLTVGSVAIIVSGTLVAVFVPYLMEHGR